MLVSIFPGNPVVGVEPSAQTITAVLPSDGEHEAARGRRRPAETARVRHAAVLRALVSVRVLVQRMTVALSSATASSMDCGASDHANVSTRPAGRDEP